MELVSFEIAKKLKGKGFTLPKSEIIGKFDSDGLFHSQLYINFTETMDLDEIIAPTISQVLEWLRKVYNLVICAEIGNENDEGNTDYYNPDRWWWFFDITNEKGVVIDTENDYILNEYSSNEEACEAAIKYCLDNLI